MEKVQVALQVLKLVKQLWGGLCPECAEKVTEDQLIEALGKVGELDAAELQGVRRAYRAAQERNE